MSEVIHDPREVDGEVVHDDEADEDRAKTHAAQPPVDVVEGYHGAAAVRLADGDLEDERRDGDDEDGEEVRDEPLQTVVVVYY